MTHNYQPIIGLEVHIELSTNSKMFCDCSVDWFSKPSNIHTCPVCLGLPGALPVANQQAIDWTIKLGLALNCNINVISKFDRKHYFYPDLPKGYQISQYDMPFCKNGKFKTQNLKYKNEKNINITRVHLEEDTGKLIHRGEETLVDFNRSGVPLVEIVTEPDFNNSEDVKVFLEQLQILVRYLDISDADMEKGSMRLEPNISLRQIINNKNQDTKKLKLPNYKVEVKNINSFKFCQRAIEYEIKRQSKLLNKGIIPTQETRGWDENKQKTVSQRSKEQAHDYRYFPEPDIPPFILSVEDVKKIKDTIIELPHQRIKRYIKDYGLGYQDAYILVKDKKTADYYELIISKIKAQMSKLQLKSQNIEKKISLLIVNKKLSIDMTEEVFINDAIKLITPSTYSNFDYSLVINKVINNNPNPVKDYQSGKENAIMFLVGQVMRDLKGQGNPQQIKKLLIEKISS